MGSDPDLSFWKFYVLLVHTLREQHGHSRGREINIIYYSTSSAIFLSTMSTGYPTRCFYDLSS